ncbi:hypothetical protein [Actinoplanes sp. N902-109]|uniref:hypothetical protein n=1 Tax=Actinoplanes sp. (strain N902-109) TaxID=649831 RepID=UPI000329535E|nr:hypothetical protein [Actinoplanes sp. N902-109]AGL17572.1 hypothetical protein L083_4062 [Actinoplanes sp. N902-109]
MTAESVPGGDDARRVLAEMRALARGVRVDRRASWVALLVLGVVTLAGIPFDWFGLWLHCLPSGACQFARRGVLYYWPAALLVAYAGIAFLYVRAARARGLGARVLPYVITGAATTVVFTAAWVAAALYFPGHPHMFPAWVLVVDRLIAPWGTIGVALLVLAWLERNVALGLFTAGYLALVLLVLPIDHGLGPASWGIRAGFAVPQAISGVVLLAGALGFAVAARRRLSR